MSLLVVGLGNPGSVYAATRHNAGFMVVDRVAACLRFSFRKALWRPYLLANGMYGGSSLFLAKPLTYMNRSGDALGAILRRTGCSLNELLVVCDNLDLPVGSCRLKVGGSSAGHNGLASLIERAQSSDFMRLYVGIGRPRDGKIVEHVLGKPEGAERNAFEEGILAGSEAVLAVVDQPIERAMNGINRRNT